MDKHRTKQGMDMQEGNNLAGREKSERDKAYLQDIIGVSVRSPSTVHYLVHAHTTLSTLKGTLMNPDEH